MKLNTYNSEAVDDATLRIHNKKWHIFIASHIIHMPVFMYLRERNSFHSYFMPSVVRIQRNVLEKQSKKNRKCIAKLVFCFSENNYFDILTQ